jgi:hypothetical protein
MSYDVKVTRLMATGKIGSLGGQNSDVKIKKLVNNFVVKLLKLYNI